MNGLSGVSRKYDGAGDFAPRSCAGWRWAQLPPLRGSGVYTGVDRLSVFLEDVGSRRHARVSGSNTTVGGGRASGVGVPRPVPRRYRGGPEPASAGAVQNLDFKSSEHQRRPSSSEFLILEGDSRERPLFLGRGGRGFGPITSASLVPLGPGRAPPGTIAARSLALAASTPWSLTRFGRGRGTQAARRATS